MKALPDELLLEAFKFILFSADGSDPVRHRAWYRLSHVCRKWRHVAYTSARSLKLSISITNHSPVTAILAHSAPPLPLDVAYSFNTAEAERPGDKSYNGNTGADRYVIPLFEHHAHRLQSIRLSSMSLTSSLRVASAMSNSFPALEHLQLQSGPLQHEAITLMLPSSFLAPQLRELSLSGFSLPANATPLANLVTFRLDSIADPVQLPPGDLLAPLSTMPHLRNLSVSFRRPVSRLAAKKWMPRKHRPRTVLPALNSLEFQGSSTYLESLLVRADTPQLKRFHITFSNQLGFTLAELSRLAEANMLIRDKQLTVTFTEEFVGVIGGSEAQDLQAFADRSLADWHYMGDFSVRVRCSRFDWQVFAASQICAALAPLVPPVQKLNLRCGASGQWLCYQDEVDHTCWHRLLQPFRATGTLLIERTLIQELSRALERRDNALELLPALQSVEIGQTGYDISASGLSMGVYACPFANCDGRRFRRKQEQYRHIIERHLPHNLYCRQPGCQWTGSRRSLLVDHLEKHHQPHWSAGELTRRARDPDYRIYDAGPFIVSCLGLGREISSAEEDALRGIWDFTKSTLLRRLKAQV